MTRRDAVAVQRVAQGLLKLVYPTGPAGDQEVIEAILSLAGELRQRIHDQLCRIAPGEFQPRRVGFGGVPESEARDLEGRGTLQVHPRSMGAGEAFYLDREARGVEGGGRLLRLEASLLAAGRGLKAEGRFGTETAQAARIAHSFLVANARSLRIDPRSLEHRAIALQVAEGAADDGQSIALPAFLAMISALRLQAFPLPVVGLGASTLHGHLSAPPDVLGRLGALRAHAPGLLVLPPLVRETEEIVRRLLPDWRIVTVPRLDLAVQELGV